VAYSDPDDPQGGTSRGPLSCRKCRQCRQCRQCSSNKSCNHKPQCFGPRTENLRHLDQRLIESTPRGIYYRARSLLSDFESAMILEDHRGESVLYDYVIVLCMQENKATCCMCNNSPDRGCAITASVIPVMIYVL
jgi:hypothetical protein